MKLAGKSTYQLDDIGRLLDELIWHQRQISNLLSILLAQMTGIKPPDVKRKK